MRKLLVLLLSLCLLIGVAVPVGAEAGATPDKHPGLNPTVASGDMDSSMKWLTTNPIVANSTGSTGIIGSTAILKSVYLKKSSSSSSDTMASYGSVSGNVSQELSISNSYSGTTKAYISWELAAGATLQSATWNGSSLRNNTEQSLPGSSKSSTLILKVKASDGKDYTATFTVKRAAGSSSSLSSLYIKNKVTSKTGSSYLYELDRDFSSSTTSYTVDVPGDEDTIYVYYDTTNSDASVSLSGGSKRTSRSGYYEVALKSGDNTLKMEVSHDKSKTTYTIYVERDEEEDVDEDASLKSLEVRKTSSSSSTRYALNKTFAYNRTSYDVGLERSLKEVYLHFSPDRSSASVSVSGTGASKVSDGVYKVSLDAGKTRTITIKVTYNRETTTYTVRLNSGGSSKATLKSLIVSSRESTGSSYQYDLLPAFDSSTLEYVVLVPYDKNLTGVYIRPTLGDTDNTLKLKNETHSSGDWIEYSLKPGDDTTVSIRVTDDDSNSTTYKLTIMAAAKNASDNADLSSYSLRTGSSLSSNVSLSPSFDRDTTSYTASVSSDQETLRVYADAYASGAKVLVNDLLLTGSYIDISLAEGKNTIRIKVYAEDADTTKSYSTTVDRSSSSALSALELRIPSGQTISMIPAFNSNTLKYRVTVPGDTAQISFRPSAADSQATISIGGQTAYSGIWTNYLPLRQGENTFLVSVSSGYHTATYTITVECGLTVVVSSQGMQVNGNKVDSAAYNINGNNYFKLRDIAYALRGTPKHFEVSYDELTRVIKMTSGFDYTIIGGEMTAPAAAGQTVLSDQRAMKDSVIANIQAYNIDGNNYFMLRDIAQLFNFGVSYDDNTRTMKINTASTYTP